MGKPLPSPPDFFQTVIAWQALHGRHSLPWQHTRDPYRVWLSEIMLQQTQVSAVLGYFDRFVARFPDVRALAQAHQDEVLAAWSGLGYYSRARNLHACAQKVVSECGGRFPASSQALMALPGIGPSTAAAIAAFCFGEPVSIFDGNVRRVLARYHGFAADLSQASAEKQLMALAQAKVPRADGSAMSTASQASDMARYTQGLMDLGATVCTRHQPACADCPLAGQCVALATGQQRVLPFKSRRTQRSAVAWWLLVLRQPGGQLWLTQRPAAGIWARMYCFPTYTGRSGLDAALAAFSPVATEELEPVTHVLTHRDLVLQPVLAQLDGAGVERASACLAAQCLDGQGGQWVQPGEVVPGGLPVPVSRWLAQWAVALPGLRQG